MKVRGERACKDCGTRWSYYETGSSACPDCGSLHSIGVDERTRHTASADDLDLSELRNALDDRPLREVATEVEKTTLRHVSRSGFVHAGDLLPLDDDALALRELRYVADAVGRSLSPDDEETMHFLTLLRGADLGDRPSPDEVPPSLAYARGLAYADAVEDYRREMGALVGDDAPDVRPLLERLGEHVKRVRALDGDVDPETVELLVAAARDLGAYLRTDDETALTTARDRLDRLG